MPSPAPQPAAHAAPVSRATLYQLIYPARVLGMALAGVAVGSVLFEQNAGAWLWALLAATFVLWPHLAYVHARFSPDSYAAERRNLLIDSLFVGIWIPLMHFNLLASAVITIITTFDKVYTLIRLLWLHALILLAVAAAVVTLLLRPQIQLQSSVLVELCVLPLVFAYTWVNTHRGTRLMRTIVKQNRQLDALRRTDAQTGLQSRDHWMEHATLALHSLQTRAATRPSTLLLIDIDHFKSINDTFGHIVGDEVISAVGKVILDSVRSEDSAGRYGGDEFAVLVSQADVPTARAIAERIRSQIEQLRFVNAPQLRLGSSIGLAVARPEHATLLDWINAADHALYRAKHQGRNQVAEAACA
ncbi:MAG: diguanylate cyclase [Thiomonas sp.]|nr:diguanylate cyclase [Thiomonas sp.]